MATKYAGHVPDAQRFDGQQRAGDTGARSMSLPHGDWVTARKNHICTLCGLLIEADSVYWRERVTPWDSGNDIFFTLKGHKKCMEFWWDGHGQGHDGEFLDPGDFLAAMKDEER